MAAEKLLASVVLTKGLTCADSHDKWQPAGPEPAYTHIAQTTAQS